MWLLIFSIALGAPDSEPDSVSITTIPDFYVRGECETAGKRVVEMLKGSTKSVRWICIAQTDPYEK